MYKAFLKRFFDLLVASASLLLLTPIAILVVIIIKIDSKGPAFLPKKDTARIEKFLQSTNSEQCIQSRPENALLTI